MDTRCGKTIRSRGFRYEPDAGRGHRGNSNDAVATAAHDAQHGAAASVDPWGAATAAGARRGDRGFGYARYRVFAHRHREGVRGQVLPAGRDTDGPHRLSRSAVEQSLLLPGGRKAA